MTRWGILSTARIAERILNGARSSQDAQIVAVGSRDLARAQAYASENGIARAHGSYEDLLADPEVDAVYIPLPNSMHVPWSVRALQEGKHVLCEKPLSRSPAQVEEAFDAAARAGRVLMEAFMWRFHAQTDELVRLVREGAVGELRVVRAAFGFGGISGTENVRLQTALEGGALMDVGCYCVSALRLLCGEPLRVSGEQVLGGDGGIDIRFTGSLRFEGDVLGLFDCGMDVHRRHSIEVVGSDGTILVPSPWQTPAGTEILLIREQTERIVPELVDPSGRELDEVGAAAAEGREPRLGREESLAQARVIEALYRAAADGAVISV
jgi:xylose dehydrogenase (NAD/NADP)